MGRRPNRRALAAVVSRAVVCDTPVHWFWVLGGLPGRVGRPSLRCRGWSWRGVSVEMDGARMHVEAQARRSSNARRLMLRAAVVAGVVGAALVAPGYPFTLCRRHRSHRRSFSPSRTPAPKRGRRPRSRRRRPSPGFPGKAAPRRAWVRASEDGSSGHRGPSFSSTPTTGPIREPPRRRERPASEPVYVGKANWLQYRVEEPSRGGSRPKSSRPQGANSACWSAPHSWSAGYG